MHNTQRTLREHNASRKGAILHDEEMLGVTCAALHPTRGVRARPEQTQETKTNQRPKTLDAEETRRRHQDLSEQRCNYIA